MESDVRFRFEGALASENELDFYEASRFQYGAARFIYTLHHFRRTGRIVQRITPSQVDSTFRISTPQKGSWEILVFEAAKTAAATVIQVPIQAMVQFGLQSVFPPKLLASNTNNEFDTAQNDALMKALQIIESNQQQNAKQTDELLKLLAEAKSTANDNLEERLCERISAIEDSLKRDIYLKNYPVLAEVTSDRKIDLIQKTRPQIREMGYPLRKSAETLDIQVAEDQTPYSSTIRLSDVETLDDAKILDETVIVVGSLKKFDKETGWGEMRQHETGKIVRFVVKRAEKRKKLSEVLDAMSSDVVMISGNPVVDATNSLKYYIFEEYVGDHEGE